MIYVKTTLIELITSKMTSSPSGFVIIFSKLKIELKIIIINTNIAAFMIFKVSK